MRKLRSARSLQFMDRPKNRNAGGAGGRRPLAGARGVLAIFLPCRRRRHEKEI